MRFRDFWYLTLWGFAELSAIAPATAGEDRPVDFARDVAPLFERSCIRCHKPGNEKGGVSLATRADLSEGGYVQAGDPAASHLLELVAGQPEGQKPAMPKEGEPLTAAELEVLRRWVTEGAVWPEQIVLREQSRAGAEWWALQPLADPSPPDVAALPESWTANPCDRFVGAKLVENGLHPHAPADRRSLLRRATYDLTGLPPSPEEVAAFMADDSADAYERLIDRLLASPRYGEHWGRHWLDVVRFGESNGYERNVVIDNLWPFRDYVIRAFNDDKPFDRLVLEHLAGDRLEPGDPAVEVGTTFLVCGPYDNVGNQDPAQAAQIRADAIDEMIRATGEAFLGLTVGCARCHDHKFDPILQRDYYALYATLAGVYHGPRAAATPAEQQARAERVEPLNRARADLLRQRDELEKALLARAEARQGELAATWCRPRVDRRGTEEAFGPREARFVRLVVEGLDTNPHARAGFRIEELEVWSADDPPRNVAAAANGGIARGASRVAQDFAEAYSPDLTIDGRFGASWIAAGPELTVEFARPERIHRVVFCSDRTGAAGAHDVATFVGEYRLYVSSDGQSWDEVANSFDRQPVSDAQRRKRLLDRETTAEDRQRRAALDARIAQIDGELAAVPPLPSWWMGQFQPADGPFQVFLGGDPQRKGETVTAASLSVLRPSGPAYELAADVPEGERRLALARWIVDPRNPLTPRVLANRLWHYHFGTGIVDTPSDFGYMGGRPSHPELLDWLARQIPLHGWRLKPLHRLIMLSQAYRQSSMYRAEAAARDADARLLWRFPPRRLTAEELRDTLLVLADRLDTRQGGPGFRLYRYIEDNVATYVPLDEHGPETYRRAVYHQNARAARIDLLTDFDSPDCAFATPRRGTTTTPLQALTMMNHRFTLDMAKYIAERIEREAGTDPEAQVRRAFVVAFGREPAVEEQDDCVAMVRAHGLGAFCRVLINMNELIYLY